MARHLLTLPLLLFVAASFVAPAREEAPTGQTLGQLLDQHGLREKFEPVLAELGVPVDSALLKQPPERFPREDEIDAMTDGHRLLRFNKDGLISKYGIFPSEVEKLPDRAGGPLSKAEFLEKVRFLLGLDAFGASLNRKAGVTITLDAESVVYGAPRGSDAQAADGEQPESGSWNFFARHVYKGIECFSCVSVVADIRTAQFTLIAHVPFVMPDSLEQKTTEEQAVKIAAGFVAEKGTAAEQIGVRRMITFVNNAFSGERQEFLASPPRTRLCWIVEFKMPMGGHDHPLEVYVDCGSGEIVGGMY